VRACCNARSATRRFATTRSSTARVASPTVGRVNEWLTSSPTSTRPDERRRAGRTAAGPARADGGDDRHVLGNGPSRTFAVARWSAPGYPRVAAGSPGIQHTSFASFETPSPPLTTPIEIRERAYRPGVRPAGRRGFPRPLPPGCAASSTWPCRSSPARSTTAAGRRRWNVTCKSTNV
jgi:hypothetical protein